MRRSRRAFITTVPALTVGCTRLGSPSTSSTEPPDRDGDGVPDDADDYPTDDRRGVRDFLAEGTVTLQPGEFGGAVALTNSPQASGDIVQYEVRVEGETGIDCLVFRRDAWDAYTAGSRDVSIVSGYSRVDVSEAEVTIQLDQGEYLFALDYTELASEPGPDSIEVYHRLEIAEPL